MKYIGIMVLLLLAGCTSPSDANKALTAQGFSEITYTGYDFFACSEDDFYHTGFKAKNSQGVLVEGTACSGILFKNTTLRF